MAAAQGDILMECALAGADRFERVCAAETAKARGVTILTIRHPDGGFRRFEITSNGRGLVAADGFDDSRIAILGDALIELSAGEDRYRLPAQVKGDRQIAASQPSEDGKSQ